MPPSSNGELSLRHLPDTSDTSFSFQIPGNTQEINLLADVSLDFFHGADISRGAPQFSSPRAKKGPLTIHDLTPRPAACSSPIGGLDDGPSSSHQSPKNLRPKPTRERTVKRTQRPDLDALDRKVMSNPRPVMPIPARLHPDEEPSSFSRLDTVKAGIDSLAEELKADPMPTGVDQTSTIASQQSKGGVEKFTEKTISNPFRKRDKRLRNNQKVAEGGIAKAGAASKYSEVRSLGSDSTSVEAEPTILSNPPSTLTDTLNGDDCSTDISMAPESGVAGRLVQYSQNLINSFGVFHSAQYSKQNTPPADAYYPKEVETDSTRNVEPVKYDNNPDSILTVSQLSPSKPSSSAHNPPTPPASKGMSLRSAGKRPASSTETFSRKKIRTDVGCATSAGALSGPSLGRRIVSGKALKPSTSSRATKIEHATTRQATSIRAKPSSSVSRSSVRLASASSSSSSVAREQPTKCPTLSNSLKGKGKATASTSKLPERPAFHIPPLGITSSTIQTGQAHLVTQKEKERDTDGGSGSQSQSRPERRHRLPIPDFKAMHAAQEAKLALLKENIHPTLPLPIRLETDRRVIERQRFDDMVKEKQREQERVEEEKRKEREEQEERELRELRKKTIPKAHIVPEWYKEAPKKKDKQVDSLGR